MKAHATHPEIRQLPHTPARHRGKSIAKQALQRVLRYAPSRANPMRPSVSGKRFDVWTSIGVSAMCIANRQVSE